MVKVGVAGAGGRMGRAIIEACQLNDGTPLVAAFERAGSSLLGVDSGEMAGIGANGVLVSDSIAALLETCDVIIDFTVPEATIEHVACCKASGTNIVIGTTGLNPEQQALIRDASSASGIVFAPNMSVGVNLCLRLLKTAAEVLGDDVDIEIIEAHHRHKIDAPSGTALAMGKVVADQLGRNLDDCAVYGRQGKTGERDAKTIGFETIRAGDIVGEHTVMFAGVGERVEISHVATSRMTFAKGAVRAAQWLSTVPTGLYDMQDVLGLKDQGVPL